MEKELEKKLKKPFSADAIEWRVARSGIKSNGEPYVIVLAYLTSRAIMDRLDEVFGIGGWNTDIKFVPCKKYNKGQLIETTAILTTLRIKTPEGEVIKTDGAEITDYESVKGGISSSLKRVAVQLGIGRYLYHLSETFADFTTEKPMSDYNNWHYIKIKSGNKEITGWWKNPQLPDWALPNNKTPKTTSSQSKSKPKSEYSKPQFNLVANLLTQIIPDMIGLEVAESHDVTKLAGKLLEGADKDRASEIISELKVIKENLMDIIEGNAPQEIQTKAVKLESWLRKEMENPK